MKLIFGFLMAFSIVAQANMTFAQSSIVENVIRACQIEIDSYCSQVTPGEGRIAECLLDKKTELSLHCRSAIDEVGLKKN